MIVVDHLTFPRIEELEVEIVERKGTGHPDTMCDGIAEAASVALCRYYEREFGRILHHNLDKALLVGGRTIPRFGGGEMLDPILFTLVGRATLEVADRRIPIEDLYREAATAWIAAHFRHLDPDRHMRFHCVIRPGSADLVDLFQRATTTPLANDTSFGVGYAPLTRLERVVYETERFLNSEPLKTAHPEIGEDIKVMGMRRGEELTLTVAIAFVSAHVRDLWDYRHKKQAIQSEIARFAEQLAERPVVVHVNPADDEAKGSIYLTLTGTSAEAGDDGQVGRGNRANGLITPFRPMSLEATAGKNPISHVGKLYNITARRIAEQVLQEIEEVEEVYCYILSQIGRPITHPQVVNLKLRARRLTRGLRGRASQLAMAKLDELPSLWRKVIAGEISVY
jgi:S-adenosylmethionine synthetase